MHHLFRYAVASILITALVPPVAADTSVDIGGQVRVRTEYNDTRFGAAYTGRLFTDMRTRIDVTGNIDENAIAFVQFQDSRTLGGLNQFDDAQSGTLNDGKNVDIHQAYIRVKKLWADGWGAQAGRFEVNLGNQRVFGAVGWSNVGRAWEGGSLWYGNDKYKATALVLKSLEVNDPAVNRDFDVFGLHIDLFDPDLEFIAFYEYDADTVGSGMADRNDLDRLSIGSHFKHRMNELDLEFNAVYQSGRQWDSLDISAYMFTGEIGYSFPGDRSAWIAGGIDYTSGDDDAFDTDVNTYNNLYYTGHKFRGYMDYFITYPNLSHVAKAGLIDLMLRGRLAVVPGWSVSGDLHYFTTASDYLNPLDTTEATKDVGIELDLGLVTGKISGLTLSLGASVFFAEKSFASDPDPETGVWLYNMATVNF